MENGYWKLTKLGEDYGQMRVAKKEGYFVWNENMTMNFPLSMEIQEKREKEKKAMLPLKITTPTKSRKPNRTKGVLRVFTQKIDLFSL